MTTDLTWKDVKGLLALNFTLVMIFTFVYLVQSPIRTEASQIKNIKIHAPHRKAKLK